MNYKKRACLTCGKEFVPHSHKMVFCNEKCRLYHEKHKKEMTDQEKLENGYEWAECVTCGEKFLRKIKTKTECSQCVKKHTKERYRKKHGLTRPKKSIQEIEREAREMNISYGQLVAMKRAENAR